MLCMTGKVALKIYIKHMYNFLYDPQLSVSMHFKKFSGPELFFRYRKALKYLNLSIIIFLEFRIIIFQ